MDQAIQFPLGLNRQDVVGLGITALVARLDAVVKFGRPAELPLLERERRIYERLGHDHHGILRYYGSLGDALILQYACHGSIRQYYVTQSKPVPLPLQLRWVEQITASIAFVYAKNGFHGDISCNNVLFDDGFNTRLCDFAGSSIDGQDPLICYETSHEHPEIADISVESELFTLGSTFYEIMTGSKPYKDLSDNLCVQARKFSKSGLSGCLQRYYYKCWTQGYTSVDELLKDIEAEVIIKSQPGSPIQPFVLRQAAALPIALTLMALLPILFWARDGR